ncbi:MAG TPA: ComEC/Rec2 family competence protein [Allosphingosinicella sp.]|nr:ComEC/Rec2 family competence protein [Allosphingosinicella sp.]
MATRDASAPSIADAPRGRAVAPILRRLSQSLEAIAEVERDQLPLWLPVGLILGIGAWFALPDADAWTAFLLLAVTGALASLAVAPGTRWGRALLLFSLAAAIGCGLVWWKAERAAAPRLERERMMEVTATVESVQSLAAEDAVRLVVRPAGEGLPVRLRVNADADKLVPGIEPGATVRLRAWLMPPAPMAVPGAYDFARAAWFQQIGGTGRALDLALVSPAPSRGLSARIAGWRQRLSAHIRARLAGAERGIAAALATGDQYGIPEADAEAMRRSGLAHLLSVSGLHLTAVVGAVMLLTLKLLALSPALALRYRLVLVAAAAGALAGIAYTLLTGAEVPTVRSCIAALLVLAGIALGREALTLRLVAVGALVVLLIWPESLPGASFQMSFAAIVAIVALHEHPRARAWFARRDEGWLAKMGRGLFALVLTGLAVEIALAPIALFHFHKAGLYGALANVIAIPLTTFVIMPLEAIALLLDLVGLGAPFWWLTGQALSLLLGLAHAAAAAPGAVALLPAMPPAAFGLIVAGGLWICLWRTKLRRWGLLSVAAGSLWALATPAPDLVVTGDGRHLALRTPDGGLALLRPRAGDYVRDTLAEANGAEPDFLDLETLPTASCSPDLCVATIERGGRRWRILATRTPHHVRWEEMVRACAAADIVVADRLLPRACAPRWLRADLSFLRGTGGLAITLGGHPRVATVAERVGWHPWAGGR